jgi:hypothetical protein
MIRQPKYRVEITHKETETNYVFTGDKVRDIRTQLVDAYMEWKPSYNKRILERLRAEELIRKMELDFGVEINS